MAVCDHFSIGWGATFLIMFIVGLSGPTFVILVYRKTLVLHRHLIKLVLRIRDNKLITGKGLQDG